MKPKPCPFCGEKDDLNLARTEFDTPYVLCDGCNASGPWASLKQKAIEAWNNRVSEEGGESQPDGS